MIGQFWKIIALLLSFALRVHSAVKVSVITYPYCYFSDLRCRVIQVEVGNQGNDTFVNGMLPTKKTIYFKDTDTGNTHTKGDAVWPELTTGISGDTFEFSNDVLEIEEQMFKFGVNGEILIGGRVAYQYAPESDTQVWSHGTGGWMSVRPDGTDYQSDPKIYVYAKTLPGGDDTIIQVRTNRESDIDPGMSSDRRTIYYKDGVTIVPHLTVSNWPKVLATSVQDGFLFEKDAFTEELKTLFTINNADPYEILISHRPTYQYGDDLTTDAYTADSLVAWPLVSSTDGSAYTGATLAPTDAPTATAATDAPVAAPVAVPVAAPVAAPVDAPVAADATEAPVADEDEDDDSLSTELTVGIVTVGVSVGLLLGFFAVKLRSGGAVLTAKSANQYGTGTDV